MKTNDLKKILKCLRVASSGISLQDKYLQVEFFANKAIFSISGTNSCGRFMIDGEFSEGSGFVDIEDLAKVVAQCKEEEINLRFKDDLLIVSFNRSRFKVTSFKHSFTENAQEFTDDPVEISAGAILLATKQVSSWCNPSSSFMTERGIYVNGDYVFIGNTNRIAIYNGNPFADSFFFYQPLVKFVEEVGGIIEFTTNDKFIRLRSDNFEFLFDINRKTQIPDVGAFYSKEVKDKITITGGQAKDLAGGASVAGGETIVMESTEEGLLFKCIGPKTDFKSIIPAELTQQFEFSFDSKIFTSAIKIAVENDEEGVNIEIFKDLSNPGFKIVTGSFVQLISVRNARK